MAFPFISLIHVYAHFYSSNLYGVMFKVTVFVQQGICFSCVTKRLLNTMLHLQMGDDITQPHLKALSRPLIVELNLLIVF